ncbi:hypothetical protein C5S36_01025 [Candidatus Methanophagaceae archaeon]|nr:hypothetical protein C5S36_01025 [Methanophagales archaeon]
MEGIMTMKNGKLIKANFYHLEIIELEHEPENMYYEGKFQISDDEERRNMTIVKEEREL